MTTQKQCYVLIPFSATSEGHTERYWTEFFLAVREIMEEQGYRCIKSDAGPYMILEEMIRNIQRSDLVVAVATDYNPNVWYELGIRHAMKNGTIVLLQEGQIIPYDLQNCGVKFYKESPDGNPAQLRESLRKPIGSYLEQLHDGSQDSPVLRAVRSFRMDADNRRIDELEQKLEQSQRNSEKFQEMIWQMLGNQTPVQHRERPRTVCSKILWVDDFPTNNRYFIELFRKKNITVHCALSTREGLDLAAAQSYDLIITDMGRGSERDAGIQLMQALKEQGSRTPVILYASDRALSRYGAEAKALGVYLATNQPGQLLSAVSRLLQLDV